MSVKLQTKFRSFSPPLPAVKRVRARSRALGRNNPDITSCEFVVDQLPDHQLRGTFYRAAAAVTLANGEVVTGHGHLSKQAPENLYAAIDQAFDALEQALTERAEDKIVV